MPCNAGNYNAIDEVADLRKLNNFLTQMLCEACQHLEFHNKFDVSGELQKWWLNHKKEDLQRMQIENEKTEQEKLKQSALSKLSSEELKALGIIN